MGEDGEAPGRAVLVIVTGGSIGLVAKTDRRREGTTVLKPAHLSEIRQHVLGDSKGTSLLLREGTVVGASIAVDFKDLRTDAERASVDPEDLDSAQVDPSLWKKVAQAIHDNYQDYQGFVVLHGLDTMAYTASALSFILGNLSVPVIVTGSQRPLNYARTDAIQNARCAIYFAGSATLGMQTVPEVALYSHDTLFRGNRASMVHASSYRSFDSPNFNPLATVGEHVEIQAHLLRTPLTARRVNLRVSVSAKVYVLDVYPGMDAAIIGSLAEVPNLRGVLLRTYGMGTAPTSTPVLESLARLVDSGIVVMNVTQARSGRISHGEDPVSLRLFEQGVISGVDMTAEAGYAKMVVILGEIQDPKEAEELLQLAYCGEQSQSIVHYHFHPGCTEEAFDEDGSPTGMYSAVLEPELGRSLVGRTRIERSPDSIKHIQLRLLGVQPVNDTETRVNRAVDFDAHLVDKSQRLDDHVFVLKQDVLRWPASGRPTINMAYDITLARDHVMNPDTRLHIETNEAIRWKRLYVSLFADVEA